MKKLGIYNAKYNGFVDFVETDTNEVPESREDMNEEETVESPSDDTVGLIITANDIKCEIKEEEGAGEFQKTGNFQTLKKKF